MENWVEMTVKLAALASRENRRNRMQRNCIISAVKLRNRGGVFFGFSVVVPEPGREQTHG